MALTFEEIVPLVLDLNALVQKGIAASKVLPADVDDVDNACAIIAAVTPDLCALIIKAKNEAKD